MSANAVGRPDRCFSHVVDPTLVTRERLCDIYSSVWWPWLIPVCSPFTPHKHRDDCTSPGKVPIERNWNGKAQERANAGEDSSIRLAQLEKHLDAGGNVGLALPPGIIVLDADSVEAAAWLVDRYPDSPFQRTNSGGHSVFVYDPIRRRIAARTKVEIVPGVVVDLRVGGKSQIVVEPSIHASGALYEWGNPL